MKKIIKTTQFKKDYKRYKNDKDKLIALYRIIKMLENDIPIPEEYKPHKLMGNYKGHWECHIENDYLLIWFDKNTNTVALVRLGTHSELFRK